jgi:hypothetical protein
MIYLFGEREENWQLKKGKKGSAVTNGIGDCRNSFYVFVSDRFRYGFAENRIQIRVS